MRGKNLVLGGIGIAMLAAGSTLHAQDVTSNTLPLLPAKPDGLGVSPVYEGWYRNPDGTITLSFGYLNRNRETDVTIPVGENNMVEPAQYNSDQPTHFDPWRSWGVFTVNVPGDYSEDDPPVTWTLQYNGERYAIPASMYEGYNIDALFAPATGLTPPTVSVLGSDEVQGPLGVDVGPLSATVGQPLSLEVSASDENNDVTLRWYDYQGPAPVTFGETELTVPQAGGTATTTATFTEPGDYTLYVRANNEPITGSGQEQCCWTNGYVKVTVTR